MKNIVVFTGAGISAESGIKTFRDSDGLWEEYNVMEVATPEAWDKNNEFVLEFYNKRRKQVIESQPNEAHLSLKKLEKKFHTHIITQNIDDLHERAGSRNILHLHGEILKSRSSVDPSLVYPIKNSHINIGEKCEKGSQLRPHVVWFGEEVPNMEKAYEITSKASVLIIIGTSLNVYPAAGLIHFSAEGTPIYLIDPNAKNLDYIKNITIIPEKATIGVPKLVEQLLNSNI
jgi:NAD-dependent deacetylase